MISFYIPDRKLQDLKMNMRLIVFLVVASLFVSMGKFNSLSFFCGRILKQMGGGGGGCLLKRCSFPCVSTLKLAKRLGWGKYVTSFVNIINYTVNRMAL